MGLRRKRYMNLASLLIGFYLVMGCAGHDHQHGDEPLPPPVYADPETAQAMKEGNRLFKERRWWRDAGEQYRIAIQAFPSMPEAHYNLGLALKKQGLHKEARVHFTRSLELEPHNPVYRNAPSFRRYEEVTSEPKPESDSHGHSH